MEYTHTPTRGIDGDDFYGSSNDCSAYHNRKEFKLMKYVLYTENIIVDIMRIMIRKLSKQCKILPDNTNDFIF